MKLRSSILFILLLISGVISAQTIITQQTGRFRVCKGKLTDSDKGKTKGDYDHNENSTLTLSVPGAKFITLKFKFFCTEKDNDVLRIFNGKDTFAALIGTYTGSKSPGTISTTDSFVTLHFISDKSVACTGWEADFTTTIITPVAPTITMAQTAKCNDDFIMINLSKAVPCDSLKVSNSSMTGPIAIAPSSITALNCSGGTATKFKVLLNGKLKLNGNYSYTVNTFFKDFCDSVYKLTSKVNFSVADCPLTVVLKADNDTICNGSCTWLRATVSGGNPAKYIYSWTPGTVSGAGPNKVCPTTNTRYILKVSDGISLPSADTVDIVVLAPPAAMADTDVCYYSPDIYLRGTPAGGSWKGTGIVNAATGQFKPLGQWGAVKTWYQIGTCADTVIVNVTLPWNLENQFCPGTPPTPVWWYGPPGGTWSGPKITPAGIFNPNAAGTYQDTYTWKGCISVKKVFVQAIKVKKKDTACESQTAATLTFSPYGIYPNYFAGLTNYYYGTYDPSQTGGPGNKMVIWNGGGCKDTTMLTILASEAGPNDTFCPSNGVQTLKNFRPAVGFTWSGRGITNPTKALYDPSFFKALGKASFIDTLTIKAGKCTDTKYVYLFPTKIAKPDTQFFCIESAAKTINNALVGLTPNGGVWSGKGVTPSGVFTASVAGYGAHKLIYTKNGCYDSLIAFVRPKPIVQNDTTVCIASNPFNCYAQKAGGNFFGPGITSAPKGTFNPATATKGIKNITYVSKEGCLATFKVTVDSMPVLFFTNSVTDYCFKDSPFLLTVNIPGGTFSGAGVVGNQFYPARAGSGKHTLTYKLSSGTCTGSANIDMTVGDTLQVFVNPAVDTICPGEIVWLRATGKGGDKFSYNFNWSHGQTGAGTFVSPKTTQIYTVTLTDGCSDPASANVPIYKHPMPWFDVVTSQPKCFGLNGFAKVKMKDMDPYMFVWGLAPPEIGDSLSAPVGNTYRLTATNKRTGCQSDTQIVIPGFKAIQAGYILNIQGGEKCISNIFPTLEVFNACAGGETGTWYWGDGSSEPYDPNTNPSHKYPGGQNNYKIKLVIFNSGGCKDSLETNLCFRDTVVVFAPTAFTPDGDGTNELYSVMAMGAVNYHLLIFNRWGQKVFETSDPSISWDGTYNGRECPEGVYSYKFTYKGRKTFSKLMAGSILLMRRK